LPLNTNTNYRDLTVIRYVDGSSETFSYDSFGRVIEATERSGDRFQYTYDSAGQLTRKTFDDGTFEAYTYDSRGNLASATNAQGTTSMEYDTEDRLIKITDPDSRFLQFTYDAEGRRASMTDQGGSVTNYSYDTAGRLAGLTDGNGNAIISYTYDAVGRLTKETNGNGTYTTYTYDVAGQLTNISNFTATNTVNSFFSYTYDNLGRQTGVTNSDGTWAYTYDGIGQLTRAQFTSTNANIANQNLTYAYDAAGNRISETINGVTTNYTTNNLNQYTQVGDGTYTYDADGNLTQIVKGGQTFTYIYNDENQLIRAVTPTGTWDYEYDAFGQRTASIQNGQRTEYVVDPFGLGDVVGEYNSSGGLIARYTQGLGLVGRFDGSGNGAYYDFDAIGSTVGLTGTSGSYVNRYSYRPFGENLLTTEGVANPFEYVGQWGVMDEASGLDYMRARYYSPTAGRFMNSDPIGQNGGINLYSYVENSPIDFFDLTGNFREWTLNSVANFFWNLGQFTQDFAKNLEPVNKEIQQNKDNYTNSREAYYQQQGYDKNIARSLAASDYNNRNPYGVGPEGYKALKGTLEALLKTLEEQFEKKFPLNVLPDAKDSTPVRTPSDAAKQSKNNWDQSKTASSPLVLDLDNDGIELISLQNSNAFFDLDADQFAEQTGWVKGDDGLLALDKNNNGFIDDTTELFGNGTTDGFLILKQLDSNNDNIINASDAQFANLRIWKDANEDGFTNTGELRSLTDWGIQSINLNYQTANYTLEGNRISSTSTYTRTDGTTRQIVDAWFTFDQLNTYYTGDYQLKAESLFLPTLRGYGELLDLHIAISEDPTLLDMMWDLVLLDTHNIDQFFTQFNTQVENLLYRWAGVENVAVDSRGQYFDGRKLAFLEQFFGEDFLQGGSANPAPAGATILQEIWSDLFNAFISRLLVQGSLADLFPEATYDLANDTTGLELTSIINSGVFKGFNITASDGNDRLLLSGLVNGIAFRSSDILNGGVENNILNAGLGVNDYIYGGDGNDLLILDYSVGDTGKGMIFYVNGYGQGTAYRLLSDNSTYLDNLYFSSVEQSKSYWHKSE
jgi:RHS repeat-associated protein